MIKIVDQSVKREQAKKGNIEISIKIIYTYSLIQHFISRTFYYIYL